jgi:hypothetical protein
VSRDASALCILGVRRSHDGHGRIALARHFVWRPLKGQRVNLSEVEAVIAAEHSRFGLKALNYDPWQATHMASRLQSGGLAVFDKQLGRLHSPATRVPMVEVSQSGANLQRMATCLIEACNDFRVELYDCPELRRDLTRLRIEERSYGFRLVAPHDEAGHGDLGTAFTLAMLAASELAAKRVRTASGGGSSIAPTSLMEMNSRARERAEEKLAREQALYDARIQEMLARPAHLDSPIYSMLKRLRSDRVL